MVRNPTKRIVDKLKSKADIEAKEKAFWSEIENAKAEALVENSFKRKMSSRIDKEGAETKAQE